MWLWVHMHCSLAFAHVQIFENFFTALHVSPCSSLGLGAHLNSLDSAIVMATLKLHFSGHVCLFQHPHPLDTYKNHVECVCFMCTAVFTSVRLRMMCTNLCLCTAGQLYNIYLPVHVVLCKWWSKLPWPLSGPRATCLCLDSLIEVVSL